MKKLNLFSIVLAAIFLFTNCHNTNSQAVDNPQNTDDSQTAIEKSSNKIQVALLLDTSNSMDGLIEQAKSRLWDIINTLTTLKFQGKSPNVEIALYEYGNLNLSEKGGYIRQVTGMTGDLDLLSEMLFSLTTYGGYEYCGAVIQESVNKIEWSNNANDMRLIYIAGNEEFNQGKVSYKEAISAALQKDIYVNTIYCGDRETGMRELWLDGANTGKGKFFNIDHNAKTRYVSTPYDDRISECNLKLNDTYISYGKLGAEKKMNQMAQDENAEKISKENYTSRAVSKSKEIYNNSSWDLVDGYKNNKNVIAEVKKEELPKELQDKSKEELEKVVVEKQKERADIQKEISSLAQKRQEYIDNELKKSGDGNDDLGKAINSSILSFAKTKGYVSE